MCQVELTILKQEVSASTKVHTNRGLIPIFEKAAVFLILYYLAAFFCL